MRARNYMAGLPIRKGKHIMRTYEVKHYTLADGWVNCWSDDCEKPILYPDRQSAEQALHDFLEERPNENPNHWIVAARELL